MKTPTRKQLAEEWGVSERNLYKSLAIEARCPEYADEVIAGKWPHRTTGESYRAAYPERHTKTGVKAMLDADCVQLLDVMARGLESKRSVVAAAVLQTVLHAIATEGDTLGEAVAARLRARFHGG